MKVLGGIDVDDERMVIVFDVRLFETVVYHARLAETAWGDECHVVAVGDEAGQLFGFLYSVTEIVRRYVTLGDKRVEEVHSSLNISVF